MVGPHSQRFSPLWISVIVPFDSTMPLIWYLCSSILANPGRLRLRLLDWRRQRWTRPYIVGLVGERATLRKIVLQSPKRKSVVPAKDPTKGAVNQLPKQLKCSHCGRNNHAVKNCFALHPDKRHSTNQKKAFEAKDRALEERFKNLALSGQISDVPSSSGAQASSSTLDYYMFGALEEVVSNSDMCTIRITSYASDHMRGCGEHTSSE